MILVHLFMEIMVDTGKRPPGPREEVFDRLMQSALVAFESQHILATLLDDLRRNLTLTTHGIRSQKLQQFGIAVISGRQHA